jgi:hypothetical protein
VTVNESVVVLAGPEAEVGWVVGLAVTVGAGAAADGLDDGSEATEPGPPVVAEPGAADDELFRTGPSLLNQSNMPSTPSWFVDEEESVDEGSVGVADGAALGSAVDGPLVGVGMADEPPGVGRFTWPPVGRLGSAVASPPVADGSAVA